MRRRLMALLAVVASPLTIASLLRAVRPAATASLTRVTDQHRTRVRPHGRSARRDGAGRIPAAPRTRRPHRPPAGSQSVGEKMRCWISLR
ncbi:hypothetical protein ABT352_19700 [Streptosporangium sp. NPDC000563]|uniref:hypothetical protein n=1 Tax=Streptosporangium sp. NPDC000563 TaxID=3154366 RepID=UPI00331FDA13